MGKGGAGRAAIAALIVALIVASAGTAVAAEHHVAPDGSDAGDGSALAPWDIATAFSHPAEVMPGDTIWLHEGSYTVTGTLGSTLSGSAEAPIVVRQAAGERATLDTGDSPENRIAIDGAYTWYWGFEVMSSAEDRWADDGNAADRGYSIDVNSGEGIKLINLVVHDTQGAIGFWSGVTDSEIYGCLIYYNGFDASDRGHGHGIYTQNAAGSKKLADNILFGQYSHGVHAYTEGGLIDDYLLEGNIAFENGIVSTVSGRTRNILIGGAPVAEDPVLRANYTYFEPGSEGTSCDLGYGSGTSNAVVQDNVLVGGSTAFRLDAPSAAVTGNAFYGPVQGADAQSFPDNDYFDAAAPSGLDLYLRPNAYEPGRAHLVVFNWDGLDAVEVDLGGAFESGDTFEIRDAQAYYGAPVLEGVYRGAPISLSMTATEVAPVIGAPATAYLHTPQRFGAFVVLKTGEDPGGAGGAGGSSSSASGSGSGGAMGSAGGAAAAGEDGGCGCRTTPQRGRHGFAMLALIGMLAARRRCAGNPPWSPRTAGLAPS